VFRASALLAKSVTNGFIPINGVRNATNAKLHPIAPNTEFDTMLLGWPKKMNVKKFCLSPPKVVPFIEKKNCAKYLFNMTIFRGGPSWS